MEPTAVVLLVFADGSVGRMQLFERDWTDADIEVEIARSVFASGKPVFWRRSTLDEFPNEHADFRAAWTSDGKTISVDIEKARECVRQRLRHERASLLTALDIDAIVATEGGDKAKLDAVKTEKQRLRDITALPEIDAAKTPDELKAISIKEGI